MPTEDKLWLPPLSAKDQEKLDRLRKNGRRSLPKWTGFTSKTLWDWLQLLGVLAIPLVVVGATLLFGIQQANLAQQQHDNDQKIANQQHDNDQKIANQQHQIDIQLANDQQQETTLKSYLDDMSDLLLNHNLRKSKPGDAVSQVARERTLTVLRRLGATRNQIVLQFLQDAHLISVNNAVIDLSRADLSNDDLGGANLSRAGLSGANLSGAHLGGAYLRDANLSGAYLACANLSGARLGGANLSGAIFTTIVVVGGQEACANLNGANLSRASLTGANLTGADLGGANLSGAYLIGANLSDANLSRASLTGANLSDAILYGAYLSNADLGGAILHGASYNTKTIQGKDAQGHPLTYEPTLWPLGLDPKVAGAICVDC